MASDPKPFAWEPLTPRGVAAFAGASVGRLWLVQFIFAMLSSAAVIWFLSDGLFPTVREAIKQLPEAGEIRSSRLDWRDDSPKLIAEGTFLAFSVDLDHTGDLHSPAHVQVEFGRDGFLIYSLLGYTEGRYPQGWVIAFNRADLEPWWGAWEPAILAIAGGVVVVGLMLIWQVLATIYCLPVWLVGFFANRKLNLGGSWRLAGAALMPGALLLAAAILIYDFGGLDLVQLAFIVSAHLVLGWIYLFVSLLFLGRDPAIAPSPRNPFVRPPAERSEPKT